MSEKISPAQLVLLDAIIRLVKGVVSSLETYRKTVS